MFVQLFKVRPNPLINQLQPLIYVEVVGVLVGILMDVDKKR